MDSRMIHDNGEVAARSFGSGLLWGAALGAALALLVAPKSGAALRGDVSASANRLGRRAKKEYDKAKSTYDRASEAVGDVSGRVRDLASDVAERASELGGRRSPAVSEPPSVSSIS